jgi:predicted transcriptional regulator
MYLKTLKNITKHQNPKNKKIFQINNIKSSRSLLKEKIVSLQKTKKRKVIKNNDFLLFRII